MGIQLLGHDLGVVGLSLVALGSELSGESASPSVPPPVLVLSYTPTLSQMNK